jgi:hypothetical protein
MEQRTNAPTQINGSVTCRKGKTSVSHRYVRRSSPPAQLVARTSGGTLLATVIVGSRRTTPTVPA